jgi:nicotinamidase-related amidase
MTRDVVKRHADVKKAAEHIATLLETARKLKMAVFFSRGGRHYHSVSFASLTDAERGIYAIKAKAAYEKKPLKAEDFEIADEVAPREGEVLITKHRSSAFFGTFLPSMLNWHRHVLDRLPESHRAGRLFLQLPRDYSGGVHCSGLRPALDALHQRARNG